MTRERDIERVLDQWFEDGPSEIADRVVDDALLTIERTTQTRGVLRLPRRFTMNPTIRLAAIALAAVAVLAIGAGLFNNRAPGNVGVPATSLPTQPSTSPTASTLVLPAGAIVIEHFGGRLDAAAPKANENAITRLWVVNAGGRDAHELLPARSGSQGGPAWSADGTRLAFTELGTIERIYTTDAAGSEPVLIDTACPDCDDNEPSFSADGKRMAFRRILFGSGRVVAPTSSVIATMDLATGNVTELPSTEISFSDQAVSEYPRWSPDGTKLLFYRWTTGSDGIPTGSALYVVDADGQNLRTITAPAFAGDAEWSPDGSQIAFSTYPSHADRMGDVPGRTPNVYTVHPDGTGLAQLTTDDVSGAPTWTSEGRILFVRSPLNAGNVASDLWLMDADGQNQQQVTHYALTAGQCCSFYAAVQPTP